jgi:hypothetical protein
MTVHRIAPNPLKHFGIEYSFKQKAVTRRTLDNVIENNLSNLTSGRPSDNVLVGLLPSREAADWYIEQFNFTIRPKIEELRNTDDWQDITTLIQNLFQAALDRESGHHAK